MLATLEIVLGIALLVLVFVDALTTTLAVAAGAGPLTRPLTGLLWRVVLSRHTVDDEETKLRFAGTFLLASTALLWLVLLWAGWALLFLGSGTIIHSNTGKPAQVLDVVYYAGFTTSTLGVGDYVASSPGWRVVTAVASFSGFMLITLAITYLFSVVQAVVGARALAVRIWALGHHPQELVARGWADGQFGSAFVQHLVDLTGEVAAVAEQHLAYPVLHYFHTGKASSSPARAIAVLDEAVLLLSAGVAGEARPDDSATEPVRQVITRYIDTVSVTSAMVATPGPPPTPSMSVLAAVGVPLVDPVVLEEVLRAEEERRTALHRLTLNDGWSWPRSA
ncbi:ion channel [Kineococcus xinjiangensis]|uniref:Ion channel n=1 Tax=Kineococcus xinjiangensis TaxID=512762 RepID=A0A2S6IF76_9ACTN|nr:potassium channel family protein [Kineococcus xinjiangensis]PPK92875.1 ion channel [Kineococcus xinjiangensis]